VRLLEETLESEDVNQYLREISGEELSANDFRTWAGTIPAATALAQLGPARSERIAREHIVQAIDVVASHLGNTRAVCRECYVHPAVLDAYIEGVISPSLGRPERRRRSGLSSDESAVATGCQAIGATRRLRSDR
jgi:DNA topoisomerase I